MSPGANGAKLDTGFVSPNASVLLVIRPAQLMKSPLGQIFPVEVASAAGMKYAGFDPIDVDEAVAFLDMTNPVAPATTTFFWTVFSGISGSGSYFQAFLADDRRIRQLAS